MPRIRIPGRSWQWFPVFPHFSGTPDTRHLLPAAVRIMTSSSPPLIPQTVWRLRHTNEISVMQPTGSNYSIQPADVTKVRELYSR